MVIGPNVGSVQFRYPDVPHDIDFLWAHRMDVVMDLPQIKWATEAIQLTRVADYILGGRRFLFTEFYNRQR